MTKPAPPPILQPTDIDRSLYLSVSEVAKIVHRTPRGIQIQCANGFIPGVIRVAAGPYHPVWYIPKTSLRFVCKRQRGRPKNIPTYPGGSAPQVVYRDAQGAETPPPKDLDDPESADRG